MKPQIESYLREHGAHSARELAQDLGLPFESVRVRLAEMKRAGRVFVAGWRRDEDGGRLYPRALWALGAGPDKARPPRLTATQYNARYRQRQRVAVPSVFHLGLPAVTRRLTGVQR